MLLEGFTKYLDHCRAAILGLDPGGGIVYANPEAAHLLGRNLKDLLGLNFVTTFCPEVPSRALTEHKTCDVQIRAKGATRFLNCRISSTGGDDYTQIGFIVAIEDRTDWHLVNQERDRLMEMATLAEVLPAIFHEFKNPLASIQALVELIIEDAEADTLREQLHSILMEIRRMKLSFEGLGSTTRNLASNRHQAVDLAIREACTIFERQLQARQILLLTQVAIVPLLPLDGAGLRGVLFNLLNNAKQACQPGDQITVKAGLSEDGQEFCFSVADTGSGMSPETLARCTHMFFTTKRLGSGIGLALCQTAVERMGGRMDITSTLGQGTCISICLPIKPVSNQQGVVYESH